MLKSFAHFLLILVLCSNQKLHESPDKVSEVLKNMSGSH